MMNKEILFVILVLTVVFTVFFIVNMNTEDTSPSVPPWEDPYIEPRDGWD